MNFVNIGFGNLVSCSQILSILNIDSAPIKRLISEAKATGRAIDASCGRKTKSIILTNSSHIILSALGSEILQNRIKEIGGD